MRVRERVTYPVVQKFRSEGLIHSQVGFKEQLINSLGDTRLVNLGSKCQEVCGTRDDLIDQASRCWYSIKETAKVNKTNRKGKGKYLEEGRNVSGRWMEKCRMKNDK